VQIGQRIHTKCYEWLERQADGSILFGLTSTVLQELGEISYISWPDTGSSVAKEQPLLVLESLKAATEIYAPISVTVIAHNPLLTEGPERLNSDPEASGWLLRLAAVNDGELHELEALPHIQMR